MVGGMKGRARWRLEMVADLAAMAAELLFLPDEAAVVTPPFWLVLEEEPADARWMPLSPLELPELIGTIIFICQGARLYGSYESRIR